jgi:hypothetical protein
MEWEHRWASKTGLIILEKTENSCLYRESKRWSSEVFSINEVNKITGNARQFTADLAISEPGNFRS